MGDQFCSVFTQEDMSELPDLGPSRTPNVPPIKVNIKGVLKLLKTIKSHKATRPDNIPGRLLKEATDELAPGLAHLFENSIDNGKIPLDWKSALVTPVFKKGNRSTKSNYLPISLTYIVYKIILERIIHTSVISHFELNNILTDSQHGFRKRRSCETQLILIIDDLAIGLNDKQQIDVILLNFSKAFDPVPHQWLLFKLKHYGEHPQLDKRLPVFQNPRGHHRRLSHHPLQSHQVSLKAQSWVYSFS